MRRWRKIAQLLAHLKDITLEDSEYAHAPRQLRMRRKATMKVYDGWSEL